MNDYLDGRLSVGEESAFLSHLVDCRVCEAALADVIQLCDREETCLARARPAPASPLRARGSVIRIPTRQI